MKPKQAPYFFKDKEIPLNGWGSIEFRKPAAKLQGVTLDLRKVAAYWRENDWYPRCPSVTSWNHDLPWHVETKRIRSLIEGISQGESIPPVNLYVSEMGGICFPDGRHRIVLLHAAGYEHIKAEVKKCDAAEIELTLGWVQ